MYVWLYSGEVSVDAGEDTGGVRGDAGGESRLSEEYICSNASSPSSYSVSHSKACTPCSALSRGRSRPDAAM
jgi:hypothetical protein